MPSGSVYDPRPAAQRGPSSSRTPRRGRELLPPPSLSRPDLPLPRPPSPLPQPPQLLQPPPRPPSPPRHATPAVSLGAPLPAPRPSAALPSVVPPPSRPPPAQPPRQRPWRLQLQQCGAAVQWTQLRPRWQCRPHAILQRHKLPPSPPWRRLPHHHLHLGGPRPSPHSAGAHPQCPCKNRRHSSSRAVCTRCSAASLQRARSDPWPSWRPADRL
mmetsp:Transcript_45594/g.97424  ORF Transcript_45594/g.97424 Transcript_45594/m.97424 type:complete len:214 (+) Transcript_45594:326-967(+)